MAGNMCAIGFVVFSAVVMSVGCATSNKKQPTSSEPVFEVDAGQQQERTELPDEEDDFEVDAGQQQERTELPDKEDDAGVAEEKGDAGNCLSTSCPSFAPWDPVACACAMDDEFYGDSLPRPIVTIEGSCEPPDPDTRPGAFVSCAERDGSPNFDLCSQNPESDAGIPCCDTESLLCGYDSGEGCVTLLPSMFGDITEVPFACDVGEDQPGWLFEGWGSFIGQNEAFVFFRDHDHKIMSIGKKDCQVREIYRGTYPYGFAATRDAVYLVEPDIARQYAGGRPYLTQVSLNGDQQSIVDFSDLLNAEAVWVLSPLVADEEMLFVGVSYAATVDDMQNPDTALIGVPCCDLPPMVLVDGLGALGIISDTSMHSYSVARDSDRLFFSHYISASDGASWFYLGYLYISSGESRLLFDGVSGQLRWLEASGGRLYFVREADLLALDPSSCDVKPVASSHTYVRGLATDADYLYWVGGHLGGTWLFAMSHETGVKQAIAEGASWSGVLGVDAQYIYLTRISQGDEDRSELVRIPKPEANTAGLR